MEVLRENKNVGDLGGQSLIQTIVSLTELPEPLMHREVSEIIQAAGHKSESLTLEQLRAAMLSYLESIQADFAEESATEQTQVQENDANSLKTLVILE